MSRMKDGSETFFIRLRLATQVMRPNAAMKTLTTIVRSALKNGRLCLPTRMGTPDMRPVAIIAGIFARFIHVKGFITLEPFFAPPCAFVPPIFGDDLRAALISHHEGNVP